MKLSDMVAGMERRIENLMGENARLMNECDALQAKLAETKKERDDALAEIKRLSAPTTNESPSFSQDPWAEYPPPPGEEWHNPDGLTPKQVGVKDGWRLALKSEIKVDNGHRFQCFQPLWKYFGGEPKSLAPRFTYRTRAPLPVKPAPKRAVSDIVARLERGGM